jgi:hypothetical protein
MLEAIPEELWDQLEMMIKARRINKNYLNSFLKGRPLLVVLSFCFNPLFFHAISTTILLILLLLFCVLISNCAV